MDVDDVLVVGPGEVLPVDGRVCGGVAVLDESALTSESLQVERHVGEPVRSGVFNAGSPFELRADHNGRQQHVSRHSVIGAAGGSGNAPIVRLADRYATWFLPLALAVAAAAWLASGSAVLVVVTPCPLLLAAPVSHRLDPVPLG
nr:hypothetical protein [Mycobacterium tilburgii]